MIRSRYLGFQFGIKLLLLIREVIPLFPSFSGRLLSCLTFTFRFPLEAVLFPIGSLGRMASSWDVLYSTLWAPLDASCFIPLLLTLRPSPLMISLFTHMVPQCGPIDILSRRRRSLLIEADLSY